MQNGNGYQAPDFEGFAREWRDRMLEDWGGMAKTMVGSDSFAAASSAWLDWSLSVQKQMRQQTGQFLESLEFPKRSDLARLQAQILGVEQRLVDNEERLDEMAQTMGRMADALEQLNQTLKSQGDSGPGGAQSAGTSSAKAHSGGPAAKTGSSAKTGSGSKAEPGAKASARPVGEGKAQKSARKSAPKSRTSVKAS